MIPMFVVMYFIMIRPQMKKQKELKSLLEGLAKGDEVVTVGGLLGRISKLGESVRARRDRRQRRTADPAQRDRPDTCPRAR